MAETITDEKLASLLWDYAQEIERTAAETYAPKGIGGLQFGLASRIKALKPVVKGDIIQIKIISEAVGEDGPYAAKQHNKVLKHFHSEGEPAVDGFQDAGEGATLEERYWDGHSKTKGYKYATRYLSRALEDHLPELNRRIKLLRG